MKVMGLVLLALALLFRAAPICAAPLETVHVTMEANCEGMADRGAPKSDHDRGKAGQVCHVCVFPIFGQRPSLTAWFWQAPAILAPPQRQLAGTLREPPTPPPRRASRFSIQHQFWS